MTKPKKPSDDLFRLWPLVIAIIGLSLVALLFAPIFRGVDFHLIVMGKTPIFRIAQ